ncbi:hypothetical protein C7H09_03115 [Marinobacter fuscus]|uniref:Uncharacterized protein n=2 Tax=Gammaproteobacteria TaxID=1236 RepID=A0A1H8MRJ9_9GAMM|nr:MULTISPECIES: hypothetical protein [Gammaproteobacteria]PSF13606.1 hypothetical protein C7H09_03115 [Marinobacter fuscus]TKJ09495.1 hypothetical protein E8Q34_16380 [Halomonas sp. 15WGF]SEO19880.1 hypothetical protein SAMN04490369_105323 [Halomonas aquamarina]
MLSVLIVKLVATAAVVIGVSVAVGKMGPRLGGILAGTPIILGPGYFFMLQERSTEFLQAAALSTLHALIATLIFAISFVLSAGRLGVFTSLALATGSWIPASLLFSLLPGGVWGALLAYGLVLLTAEFIRHRLQLRHTVVIARSGWFDLLLRGLLAGILVSIATTLAARTGPFLSGILVGFPVGLFTIGWTLYERYGPEVARATVSMAQKGMLSLVAFALALALVVDTLPPMATFAVALAASMAVSLGIFVLSQWRYRMVKTGEAI